MKERTTDIKKLRKYPGLFTWGTIEKIHDIGEYTIAEYVDDENSVSFHVWVDDVSTSESYPTLDRAIAAAIAHKHEGFNHRADKYFLDAITNLRR